MNVSGGEERNAIRKGFSIVAMVIVK